MPRPRAKNPARRKLLIGVGSMVLAATMAIPRLMGGDEDIVPPDEKAPQAWELFDESLSEAVDEDGVLGDSTVAEPDTRRVMKDLLAMVGSASKTRQLPRRFWRPRPKPQVPAEDAESTGIVVSPPSPVEPAESTPTVDAPKPIPVPRHRVTLIYLTKDVLRALVDGRVVGVGDAVGTGTVKNIEPEWIEVVSDAGTVRYALGSDTPRVVEVGREGVGWKKDDPVVEAGSDA